MALMDGELIQMHQRVMARADEYDQDVRAFMQHLLLYGGMADDGRRKSGWAHANYYTIVTDLAPPPRLVSLDQPSEYDEMEMGECYRNALELAMGDDDLIYCEGFAQSSFIPLEHAWVERRSDGLIIDPTWQPNEWTSECAYLGIKFETEFVVRRTMHVGWTSLFGGDACRIGNNDMLRRGLRMHDDIAYDFKESS